MKAVNKRDILRSIGFLIKLAAGLAVIFPLIYGLCLSFLPNSEINSPVPILFSANASLDNYRDAFSRVPLLVYYRNTLTVCAIQVLGQVITASCAAYAFAFFQFRGKKALFVLSLATLMIPYESNVISNYLTISQLRLTDSFAGLTLPFLATGMGVFLMRQFYMTLPVELKEAGNIDGCGHMRFLVRIAMPLSMPSCVALGLYAFINAYNQYLWPLLVTNTNRMRTIQIGTGVLMDSESINYGIVLAAAMLTVLPVVMTFIIGQKYIVKGMVAGAVKG